MIETLIIIRTKNEDRWIKYTIEKILKQKYKKFEIVVVDNYSTDRTIEIVKKYKLKILKIKKFLPGKALNLAVKTYKSKYIVCLSAHCIPYDKMWLHNLINNLKSKSIAAVYGKQIPMFNTNMSDYRDLKNIFGNEKKIQKKDSFFHNANSAIKSSLLIKYPFSETTSNIEDRIWAKKILSVKKNYQIIYEPKAAVYHHHGLHHSNKIDRLKNITAIMKNIDNEEKPFPEIFNLENQKVYACLVGRKPKFLSKKYIDTNRKLIDDLEKNNNIKKIILVLDKYLIKTFKIKKNKKFYIVKRNKKIDRLTIENLLVEIYKKIRKFEPDYFLYTNTDYIFRPKNFIDNLISKAIYNLADIVSFAVEEPSNIWVKRDNNYVNLNSQFAYKNQYAPFGNLPQNEKYYFMLFGLGSIFFFNNLKRMDFQNKKVEFMVIKNKLFLQRFSQQI